MEAINLRTTNPADRVALRGVRVHAVLAAMSQKTLVEQTFVNRERHAIEAVYTFPLPDGAAVCGFEVVTGDRVLTGVIEETDNAIEKYESAIADGDAAYLAEQERPDVFTIRVGNIKPQQAATMRLTYICPLDVTDNHIRVTFPTTAAPRFVADAGMDPLSAAMDGDALNPPHVLSVPYGLTFSADVRLGRKVKTITSPSHAIQITGDDEDGYRVSLSGCFTTSPSRAVSARSCGNPPSDSFGPGVVKQSPIATVAMDREIVLGIELTKEVGPSAQFEEGKDNQSFLAVTFVPEFAADPDRVAISETVFVLDCSGSMGGSSIVQATAALELCLRSLNAGDTFNICKFGSTFQLMSPEPVVYSQATLDQAIAYIATRNNLGGTELFQPLEAVLRIPPPAGIVRSVILLTDGQVTNEPAILNLARRHRGRNRIFSFGIGPACSSFLVKGLARATGGAAEFIAEGESIHEKVLRTFARLASPLATDVRIDWGGAEAQTLAELPPVFDGEVLTVFARVLGRRPTQVVLKCKTEAGEQSWPVAMPAAPLMDRRSSFDDIREPGRVAPDRADTARLCSSDHQTKCVNPLVGCIGTMWARRTIQSLEEVNGITRLPSADSGSRERDMLIGLSKEFGLLSSLTTFVAVEHRSVEERNEGRPAMRRVPVMLARGWGGVESSGSVGVAGAAPAGPARMKSSAVRMMLTPVTPPSMCAPPAASADSPGIFGRLFGARKGIPQSKHRDDSLGAALFDAIQEPRAQQAVPIEDDLSHLLHRQSAAGDFQWDKQMDQIASTVPSWGELCAKVDAWAPAGIADRQSVLSTVRSLLLLQMKFAGDEAMWKRAAEKAIRFVAKATGQSAAVVRTKLRELH